MNGNFSRHAHELNKYPRNNHTLRLCEHLSGTCADWELGMLFIFSQKQTLLILRAEKSQFSLLTSTAVRWFRVLLCRTRRAKQVVLGQGGGRCISTGQSLKYNFWRASCGLAESTAAKAEHFPWICGPRALPPPVLFARTGDKGLWAECLSLGQRLWDAPEFLRLAGRAEGSSQPCNLLHIKDILEAATGVFQHGPVLPSQCPASRGFSRWRPGCLPAGRAGKESCDPGQRRGGVEEPGLRKCWGRRKGAFEMGPQSFRERGNGETGVGACRSSLLVWFGYPM